MSRTHIINPDNVFKVSKDGDTTLIFTTISGHNCRVEYATKEECSRAFSKLCTYIEKKFKAVNG